MPLCVVAASASRLFPLFSLKTTTSVVGTTMKRTSNRYQRGVSMVLYMLVECMKLSFVRQHGGIPVSYQDNIIMNKYTYDVYTQLISRQCVENALSLLSALPA